MCGDRREKILALDMSKYIRTSANRFTRNSILNDNLFIKLSQIEGKLGIINKWKRKKRSTISNCARVFMFFGNILLYNETCTSFT